MISQRENFEALYTRYKPLVQSMIRRSVYDRDFREDVEQDVWLRLTIKLIEGVDADFKPQAWLMKVTKNLCIDEARRVKTRAVTETSTIVEIQGIEESALTLTPSTLGLPEVVAEHRELTEQIMRTAARMRPRQRMALVLRHVYNLTQQQVASEMGTTVAAIETLLWRARQSFIQRWQVQ
jgi:RNA polymerase sigma-70 factor, ECF subfamily